MAMIYLIRHGQASFLNEDYDKLSELGKEQSRILGEAMRQRKIEPDVVGGGTLVRHRESFNSWINSSGQAFEYTEAEAWNEYDHMELLVKHNPRMVDHEAIEKYVLSQKHPAKALQQLLNASIMDWMQGKHTYTIGWEEFKGGVWNQLLDVANQLEKGGRACIFTSGGPISVVMMHLLDLKEKQFIELQGRLVNSSVTKVLVGKNGLSLSTYNDYSHLEHDVNLITYR